MKTELIYDGQEYILIANTQVYNGSHFIQSDKCFSSPIRDRHHKYLSVGDNHFLELNPTDMFWIDQALFYDMSALPRELIEGLRKMNTELVKELKQAEKKASTKPILDKNGKEVSTSK